MHEFASRRALGLPNRHARPAHSAIRRSRWPICVRLVVRVPGPAMCLARSLRGRARASTVVLTMRDQLHVPDVHARSRLAQVVNLQAVRDRSMFKLPDDAMDIVPAGCSAAQTDGSVSIAVVGAQPQPAVVGATLPNPGPQALCDRDRLPAASIHALRAQAPAVGSARCIRRIGVPVLASQDQRGPRLRASHRRFP